MSSRLTYAITSILACTGSAAGPVRILAYFGSFTANRSTCSIFGG
jgi:hypothetical protein